MKDILLKKLEKLGTKEAKYNFIREYLQELMLMIIDRRGFFKNLAFVGGTALRVLYDLRRFSEDLDFSLINKKGFSFPSLLKVLERELELNGFSIEEARSREKTILGEFIRFKGLLYETGLSSQKSEKLFVKLEIDSNPPKGYGTEIVMINKNFLFKVQSYDIPSLFASKLHAFLFRKYVKGRDYYDLLWFFARKSPINYALLSNAASQTGKRPFDLDADKTQNLLLARINRVDFSHVLKDVRPFLEIEGEENYFKKEYFINAIEKYFAERV